MPQLPTKQDYATWRDIMGPGVETHHAFHAAEAAGMCLLSYLKYRAERARIGWDEQSALISLWRVASEPPLKYPDDPED